MVFVVVVLFTSLLVLYWCSLLYILFIILMLSNVETKRSIFKFLIFATADYSILGFLINQLNVLAVVLLRKLHWFLSSYLLSSFESHFPPQKELIGPPVVTFTIISKRNSLSTPLLLHTTKQVCVCGMYVRATTAGDAWCNTTISLDFAKCAFVIDSFAINKRTNAHP